MQYKAKLDAGGRILIPAHLRQLFNLQSGDEILLSTEGDRITLLTVEKRLEEIQQKLNNVVPPEVSLTDEVIEMRRRDETSAKNRH